ncbi:MAG: tetraacyldisaccharide 4'-kinase [Acidobacteriia bacterium]|nr:tetraacyldisaccharide 4'-kinase [Terriglobia bacterium]
MNPVSSIFGVGVAMRNVLYDRGIFHVRKLARPVVSVGNISVGGTGKTPFVVALGELLKQRGIAFDILSRGYGRTASGIAVVDPSGSPGQFGDEPLLLARKLQVPVIVGADRYQAGLAAEKQFSSALHLLDDGFQHRRLHRDFNIILLPADDYCGTLLPVGRLREPITALRRADAVVLPNPIEQLRFVGQVWPVRRQIELSGAGGNLIAFCGIGCPAQFFDGLKRASQKIAETVAFRDHHSYEQRDIEHLLRLKKQTGADGFITTEKDIINLGAFSAQLQPLQSAGLRMELESPEQAITGMLKTLEQRSGCRF